MGFQKVIVAIDRSPLGTKVFTQALELASWQSSHLLLSHYLNVLTAEEIAPMLDAGIGLSGRTNFARRQREYFAEMEEAEIWLQGYCQQAIAQGVQAEMSCRMGDAGSQICEAAKDWHADLIVIGRRGHSGLKEAILGSVSNYVVHHAPCSVLVIQG